jgi:phospholipid N-methyltransferase
MKVASYLRFFWAGLLKSEQTGAIVPSQRFLVDRMLDPVPASFTGRVVELGAGTGALTVRLAQKCPRARIIACEINPVLAKDLRTTLNRAGINGQVEVVRDSAEHLLASYERPGAVRPEFVISGIPLGNVPRADTYALIQQICQSLPRNGMYIQFQYSLIDRAKIQESFPSMRTVPVLLNFPPAFIYYATKA